MQVSTVFGALASHKDKSGSKGDGGGASLRTSVLLFLQSQFGPWLANQVRVCVCVCVCVTLHDCTAVASLLTARHSASSYVHLSRVFVCMQDVTARVGKASMDDLLIRLQQAQGVLQRGH